MQFTKITHIVSVVWLSVTHLLHPGHQSYVVQEQGLGDLLVEECKMVDFSFKSTSGSSSPSAPNACSAPRRASCCGHIWRFSLNSSTVNHIMCPWVLTVVHSTLRCFRQPSTSLSFQTAGGLHLFHDVKERRKNLLKVTTSWQRTSRLPSGFIYSINSLHDWHHQPVSAHIDTSGSVLLSATEQENCQRNIFDQTASLSQSVHQRTHDGLFLLKLELMIIFILSVTFSINWLVVLSIKW